MKREKNVNLASNFILCQKIKIIRANAWIKNTLDVIYVKKHILIFFVGHTECTTLDAQSKLSDTYCAYTEIHIV